MARTLLCPASHCTRNYPLISVESTEIFLGEKLPENPYPLPACQVCGERPGTVRAIFAAGPQRRAAVLCEQSAAEMSGRTPQPQPQPRKAGALDEFGRDLTADAAEGRIDPVIGRAA